MRAHERRGEDDQGKPAGSYGRRPEESPPYCCSASKPTDGDKKGTMAAPPRGDRCRTPRAATTAVQAAFVSSELTAPSLGAWAPPTRKQEAPRKTKNHCVGALLMNGNLLPDTRSPQDCVPPRQPRSVDSRWHGRAKPPLESIEMSSCGAEGDLVYGSKTRLVRGKALPWLAQRRPFRSLQTPNSCAAPSCKLQRRAWTSYQ